MKIKMFIAVLIVVALSVYAVTFFMPSETVYVKQDPVVEVQEVDALEEAIKKAQEDKKVEIEAIAQAAYDAAYAVEMDKVELQVVTEFDKSLEVRKTELTASVKEY